MSTDTFAKIFETKEYGQILVTKDIDDNGDPAIIFSVKPDELGVCKLSSSYKDTDNGRMIQNKTFDDCDIETAKQAADVVFNSTKEMREEIKEDLKQS